MPEATRFLRGQDPKETMKIGIANVIFKKTTKGDSKAYSYGLYYGDEEWMRIIQWLLKKKYTPFDVENILRSKIMRWASDHAPEYRKMEDLDEPQNTLEDFTHYIKQPNNFRPRFKSAIDDFLQNEIYTKPEEEEYWREALGYDKKGNPINEDMGGVGAPMATLTNTPGMGNAVPASPTTFGSGDKWGGLGAKPKKKKKGKKIKLVKESLDESL